MESSRPSLGDSPDGQTPLRGDEEARLGLLENPTHDYASGGGQPRSISQHPWILVDIAVFMFCMSLSLTCHVGAAIWLFQLFCFTFLRSTTEPDIFTLLRVVKFAPVAFVIVATSELAAYI